jgi:hypothetical protein
LNADELPRRQKLHVTRLSCWACARTEPY